MIHFLPVKPARLAATRSLLFDLDIIYDWRAVTDRTWVGLWADPRYSALVQFELRGGVLHEMGTVVAKAARGTGLAVALWSALLRDTGAREVRASLVTPGGGALAYSLHRLFPEVQWTFY